MTTCGRLNSPAPCSMPTPPVIRSAPLCATARPLSAFSYPAWMPPYSASVASPGASTGTPSSCPTSVHAAHMSAVSAAPKQKVPPRMSSRLVPAPMTSGAPGACSWMAVAQPRNSARFMTTEPATVTGAVAPAIGIGYTTTGPPARATSTLRSSSG